MGRGGPRAPSRPAQASLKAGGAAGESRRVCARGLDPSTIALVPGRTPLQGKRGLCPAPGKGPLIPIDVEGAGPESYVSCPGRGPLVRQSSAPGSEGSGQHWPSLWEP